MLLVDLWNVVMMLSGSGCSTARTAQLTGKHPTEPNPERVDLNGARNPVELFFNKIEQHRRRNRYFKLAANYLAVIQLAAIRLRSRINEVHTLVELIGDLVLLLREITFGLPYSALSTKSLSALDSAPQISPLRPASCRTLA
jgi:hypothetical protein